MSDYGERAHRIQLHQNLLTSSGDFIEAAFQVNRLRGGSTHLHEAFSRCDADH